MSIVATSFTNFERRCILELRDTQATQSAVVVREGLLQLYTPRMDALGGFHCRRLREPAGDRHLQLLERAEQLQRCI